MSIVPQSAPSGLTSANSLLQASKAPGVKERAAKVAARSRDKAEEQQQHAGAKRRREEEEAAEQQEQEEEEKQHMGAAARFAAAREQKLHEGSSSAAAAASTLEPGSINLAEGAADGANPEEINLDDEEEEDEGVAIAVKQVPDAVFGLGGGK